MQLYVQITVLVAISCILIPKPVILYKHSLYRVLHDYRIKVGDLSIINFINFCMFAYPIDVGGLIIYL